jgi:hypothetical protein
LSLPEIQLRAQDRSSVSQAGPEIRDSLLTSFHPQMVYFPNLGVNRRGRLCGVASYASAQPRDFLDLGKISTCVNWKHYKVPGLI